MSTSTIRGLNFTCSNFPSDSSVLASSGLLFGGSVEPFKCAEQEAPNVLNSTLRCSACEAYWWPGCHWRGNDTWVCGLCGAQNEIFNMPTSKELRDYVMLYKNPEEKKNPIIYFSLIDLESSNTFIESSIKAIATCLSLLPKNVRVGLALSGKDSLTIVEYNEEEEQQDQHFVWLTTRLKNEKFRVDLKESTDVLKASTHSSVLLIQSLTNIKRYEDNSIKSSCIGRSLVNLLDFLSTPIIAGAHVFVFSEVTTLSNYDIEIIQRRNNQDKIEYGVGLDYICPKSLNNIDPLIKNLTNKSGGEVLEHDFNEIEKDGLIKSLRQRCLKPFIFRGLIKARACPELSIGALKHFSSSNSSNSDGNWWFVNLFKKLASTILSSENTNSSSLLNSNNMNFFLGVGSLQQDGIWSIPIADPQRCSLGFELEFTESAGLENLCYPRSAAVQIASTFVTNQGDRYIRIETRNCENDRLIRDPTEVWKSTDAKTIIFLLIRILLYSGHYTSNDYREVIIDWSGRVSNRIGRVGFEKKFLKPLFGFLHLNHRDPQAISANDIEKFLCPFFYQVGTGKPQKLSQTSVQMGSTYVLDAVTEVFLINFQDETEARNFIAHSLKDSTNSPELYLLSSEMLLSNDSLASPFAVKTDQSRIKDKFLKYMFEDSSEYVAFSQAIVERSKVFM